MEPTKYLRNERYDIYETLLANTITHNECDTMSLFTTVLTDSPERS